jgi:hypothetical protein
LHITIKQNAMTIYRVYQKKDGVYQHHEFQTLEEANASVIRIGEATGALITYDEDLWVSCQTDDDSIDCFIMQIIN